MSWIFWGSIFCIFYAYFGYPLSLVLIGFFRRKVVEKKQVEPLVTMIITAYNEERRIEAKIANTLQLDYPRENLEIIIASDGSTDATNEIIKRYERDGLRLLAFNKRRGKEFAQKDAAADCTRVMFWSLPMWPRS